MRTTVLLDDRLIEEAKRITGQTKTSKVLNLTLESFVERANRQWLASLEGSIPDLVIPPRKRFE